MSQRFDDWEGEHLQHYGVLGMKWGQRRFQNKDGSLTSAGKRHYEKTGEYGYTYRSHATKKYTKKAAKAAKKAEAYGVGALVTQNHGKQKKSDKYAAKASKYIAKSVKMKNRAKRSAEVDRREQEYAQRVRTGGNLIARALTSGVVGGKAYQQHLAMNKDTKTTGSKVTSAVVANVFGRAGSAIRKADYIRQDEADRGAAFRERAAAAKATFESGVNKAAGAVKSEYNKQKKKQKRG